ncbi:hypothetical protein I350_06197 [Cryptococcus amylolentus CBS 6273]|uniref:C2H2-type domain-containing protein n=1 Tax=Cryptococcus amylolentus CBS 6273 TaxID=1296118 RepID=A0A1E3JKJ1_9TREE|nr:hypothetical protein I350_06197 [Cryptococcus amylolentus CBS 6273]
MPHLCTCQTSAQTQSRHPSFILIASALIVMPVEKVFWTMQPAVTSSMPNTNPTQPSPIPYPASQQHPPTSTSDLAEVARMDRIRATEISCRRETSMTRIRTSVQSKWSNGYWMVGIDTACQLAFLTNSCTYQSRLRPRDYAWDYVWSENFPLLHPRIMNQIAPDFFPPSLHPARTLPPRLSFNFPSQHLLQGPYSEKQDPNATVFRTAIDSRLGRDTLLQADATTNRLQNMRHENSRASLLLGAPLFSPSLAPPWPSVAPPWPSVAPPWPSVTSPLSVAPLWPLTFYSAPHPLPPLILSLPSPPSPNLPGPSSPASPPVVPVPKGTELDIPFRNALKFFARLSEAVCHEACDTVYRAPDSRRTRKHRTFWANGPSDYVGTNPQDPLRESFTFRELDKPQRPLPKCSDCGKVFSTNGNRDIHKVDVHGPKTFACQHDGCVNRYASEWRLNQHVKKVHSEKTVACTIKGCVRMSATNAELRSHMELAHSNGHSTTYHLDSAFISFPKMHWSILKLQTRDLGWHFSTGQPKDAFKDRCLANLLSNKKLKKLLENIIHHENSWASLLPGAPLFSPSLASPRPSVAPPLSVAPLWPLPSYSDPPLLPALPSPALPKFSRPLLPGLSLPVLSLSYSSSLFLALRREYRMSFAAIVAVPVPKGTELDIPFRNALKFFARLSEAVCHEAFDTIYRAPDSRREREEEVEAGQPKPPSYWLEQLIWWPPTEASEERPEDVRVDERINAQDPLRESFSFWELDKPQRPLPKCSDCGKVFTTDGNRDIHKVDVHGPKTFVCEHDGCVTRLASEWRLKRHMRLVHRKNSAM